MALNIRNQASRACWRRATAPSSSPLTRLPVSHHIPTASIRGVQFSSNLSPKAPVRKSTKSVITAPKVEGNTSMPISLGHLERAMGNEGSDIWQHSAQEYFDCVASFDAAVRKSQDPCAIKLPGYTAEMLHESACLLRWVVKFTPGCHPALMWASASYMGLEIATVTLARELFLSGQYGAWARFSRTEKRFKEIVTKGKDPNALTVQGEIFFAQKQYIKAMQVLEQALRLNAPSFQWQLICQLCLARTYAELGRTKEAKATFEELHEAGLPDGTLQLGLMVRSSDPDRAHALLYEAACKGRPSLFTHLAEIELERASNAGNAEARDEHKLWAMEWSRLADKRMVN